MSFCFDGGDYIRLERGSTSDNCSCTPVSRSSTSGPINVDNVISLIRSDGGKATLPFKVIVISSTSISKNRGGKSSVVRGFTAMV